MSTYGYPTHHWRREDIMPGLWLSLGLSGADGVTEVTERQFFPFDPLDDDDHADGEPQWFSLIEPTTFDKVVVSRQRDGEVADVLHNGMQRAGPGFPVEVIPHWKDIP